MKRRETILLLARILRSCQPSNVTFISLERPNAKADGESEGYELHFKWNISDKDFSIIKGIVANLNLGFKDYDGRLVIYTPQKTVNKLNIIA